MYPNQHLINSLRTVGNKVLNPSSEWDFKKTRQCNCGLLAKELGVNQESYQEDLIVGYWHIELEERKEEGEETCPQTKLPLTPVFQVLASYGITAEDIYELEMVGRYHDKDNLGHPVTRQKYVNEEYRQVIANHLFQKADELAQQLNTLQQSHKIEVTTNNKQKVSG